MFTWLHISILASDQLTKQVESLGNAVRFEQSVHQVANKINVNSCL